MDVWPWPPARTSGHLSRIYNTPGALGTGAPCFETCAAGHRRATRSDHPARGLSLLRNAGRPSADAHEHRRPRCHRAWTWQRPLEDARPSTSCKDDEDVAADWFEQVRSTSVFGVPIGANHRCAIERFTTETGIVLRRHKTDKLTNEPLGCSFATAFLRFVVHHRDGMSIAGSLHQGVPGYGGEHTAPRPPAMPDVSAR